MKFKTQLYYCSECKTISPSLNNLLFIEERNTKGFCSEACIEDFFTPIVRHYEKLETNLRIELGLEDEDIELQISNKEFVEDILASCNEIWKQTNEIDEDIYTYIKHFPLYSGIVICKVYNRDPSFIFLNTRTRSKEFLNEVRVGKEIFMSVEGKIKDELSSEEESFDEHHLSEDDFNFMQLLENKKSKLLAELLEKRVQTDIPFEEFMDYEVYFNDSLENPDEVFESVDNEGDSFFVYIKSFILDEKDFFYIISCLKKKDNSESSEVNVFPVLAFPTNDINLYALFRHGKKISGHISN